MSFETFLRLVRDTYDRPQEVARSIMSLGVPANLALAALGLVAVITTFLSTLANAVMARVAPAAAASDPMAGAYANPLLMAAIQFGGMIFGAVLIHRVGRMFGGRGDWGQTLPLVAWLQIVFLVLQAAQLLLTLAVPILTLPALMFVVFSIVFLTAQFICALHGFASIGKVIGGMILTTIVVSFGLAVLYILLLSVFHVPL